LERTGYPAQTPGEISSGWEKLFRPLTDASKLRRRPSCWLLLVDTGYDLQARANDPFKRKIKAALQNGFDSIAGRNDPS